MGAWRQTGRQAGRAGGRADGRTDTGNIAALGCLPCAGGPARCLLFVIPWSLSAVRPPQNGSPCCPLPCWGGWTPGCRSRDSLAGRSLTVRSFILGSVQGCRVEATQKDPHSRATLFGVRLLPHDGGSGEGTARSMMGGGTASPQKRQKAPACAAEARPGQAGQQHGREMGEEGRRNCISARRAGRSSPARIKQRDHSA